MKYEKIISKISSGTCSRAELAQMRRNASTKFAQGDVDAGKVIEIIGTAVPSDPYVIFMGFCPDANVDNRLDNEWKTKGICQFDWGKSEGQMTLFEEIVSGDRIILKKREKFGKTMKLYGYGRVTATVTDGDGRRYLKVDWAKQENIIEVPLMGCNSTVNLRSMDKVKEQLPKEFLEWINEPTS